MEGIQLPKQRFQVPFHALEDPSWSVSATLERHWSPVHLVRTELTGMTHLRYLRGLR